MPPCVAVKSSGAVCGKGSGKDYHGVILCGIHCKPFIQSARLNGHEFAIIEQRQKDNHILRRNAVRLERENAFAEILRLEMERQRILHQDIIEDAIAERLDGIRNVIDERPHPVGALRRIANDSQNVHTTL